MKTIYEEKLWEGEFLRKKHLEETTPNTVIAKGHGYIEHPWFNGAKMVSEGGTVEEDGRHTKVRFVVFRGGIADWKIYHSLDANFISARYLDDPAHLDVSWERIEKAGAGLHNERDIRRLVPCTDRAFEMYRH